jgi:predicted DNA-binding protein (MmcQ/YjbR family)
MAMSCKRADAVLRDFALAFPQAREEFPWGHRAVKVKGKVFVFMALIDRELSLSMKLPVSGRTALTLPFASPTEYGLGKSGWVTARFRTGETVPIEMLKEWIEESFRAVAPKRLLAEFEESEAPAPRTAKRKK